LARPFAAKVLLPLLLGAGSCLSSPSTFLAAGEPQGTEPREARNVPEVARAGAAQEGRARAPERDDAVEDAQQGADEPERPTLLDTWSLAAREDGEACREDLKAAGFKFHAYADKIEPDKSGCGIPHAVVVMRGPTGIQYKPPITVDCSLARALASVEEIVQEEAELHLHARITRIGNLGGFACRPRNYKKKNALSAHAFGSAVDFSSFHPAKGQPAIIARDYAQPKKSTAAQDDRRRFLRSVYTRLRRREADLTYIVGPDFNRLHHDHFHLDRGGWHFWFNR
jgi:hypothetical protein